MDRVGISDFRLCERCYFDGYNNLTSVKYRFYHDLDRNGIDVEFDNNFYFEDKLTDLLEWAFRLGKESKVDVS